MYHTLHSAILYSKVGRILKTLDRLSIQETTFVYFASDHGAHIDIGAKGGSNMPFKGGKGMGAIEGGIRVPGVIRYPRIMNKNKADDIDMPTTLMDFLPTVKQILEEENDSDEIFLRNPIDGKSFLSLLQGQTKNQHTFIRHYCGTTIHALRLITEKSIHKAWFKRPLLNENGHCGEGKLCSCFGNSNELKDFGCDIEIFDLGKDPLEETAISNNSKTYNELKLKFLKEYVRIENNISSNMMKCYVENTHDRNTKIAVASDEFDTPSQLSSFFEVMPRPWMQPCAKFPFCSK